MAMFDSKLYAPGVRVTEYFYCNEYCGTAEALVSAGLARLDQFPGQPGMGKSCVTFYGGERLIRKPCNRDEKYLHIQKYGKKFTVKHGVSKEIEAERRVALDTERDAEREVERNTIVNKHIAEGTLLLMPKTPEEYRHKLVEDWDRTARSTRNNALLKKGTGADVYSMAANGFHLEDSDIEKFDCLVREIRTLFSECSVLFNRKRQNEIIANCKAAIAKGDTKFQRVLASCIE
jgi:hypothetical protein